MEILHIFFEEKSLSSRRVPEQQQQHTFSIANLIALQPQPLLVNISVWISLQFCVALFMQIVHMIFHFHWCKTVLHLVRALIYFATIRKYVSMYKRSPISVLPFRNSFCSFQFPYWEKEIFIYVVCVAPSQSQYTLHASIMAIHAICDLCASVKE